MVFVMTSPGRLMERSLLVFRVLGGCQAAEGEASVPGEAVVVVVVDFFAVDFVGVGFLRGVGRAARRAVALVVALVMAGIFEKME